MLRRGEIAEEEAGEIPDAAGAMDPTPPWGTPLPRPIRPEPARAGGAAATIPTLMRRTGFESLVAALLRRVGAASVCFAATAATAEAKGGRRRSRSSCSRTAPTSSPAAAPWSRSRSRRARAPRGLSVTLSHGNEGPQRDEAVPEAGQRPLHDATSSCSASVRTRSRRGSAPPGRRPRSPTTPSAGRCSPGRSTSPGSARSRRGDEQCNQPAEVRVTSTSRRTRLQAGLQPYDPRQPARPTSPRRPRTRA